MCSSSGILALSGHPLHAVVLLTSPTTSQTRSTLLENYFCIYIRARIAYKNFFRGVVDPEQKKGAIARCNAVHTAFSRQQPAIHTDDAACDGGAAEGDDGEAMMNRIELE